MDQQVNNAKCYKENQEKKNQEKSKADILEPHIRSHQLYAASARSGTQILNSGISSHDESYPERFRLQGYQYMKKL